MSKWGSRMRVLIIATLMCSVCLTFASPTISAEMDSEPGKVVIIGNPMNDDTDPADMVMEFERIHSTKKYYESRGSHVYVEDPSTMIHDHILKTMASSLKHLVGKNVFIQKDDAEIREVHPDSNIPVDSDFVSKAIDTVKEMDGRADRVLKNMESSLMSIYNAVEDTRMVETTSIGSDRKDDEQEDEADEEGIVFMDVEEPCEQPVYGEFCIIRQSVLSDRDIGIVRTVHTISI